MKRLLRSFDRDLARKAQPDQQAGATLTCLNCDALQDIQKTIIGYFLTELPHRPLAKRFNSNIQNGKS